MKKFQVAYVPIGVPTFHMESAQAQFDDSVAMLRSLTPDGIYPEKMLLSIDDLKAFLDKIVPDLIILQNITFANAAFASEVLKRFNCPLLLWTLREPVIDGGRLRLNSLTGAYSAANAMHAFGRDRFEYVFGAPGEEQVQETIRATIRAAALRKKLRSLRMAAVGHTPQGFGFGRALDGELLSTFGIELESVEARELIAKAETYSDEECDSYLADTYAKMSSLETIPKERLRDYARLYKAYQTYVEENRIGALASRCWPDFFTAYGTPVCAVLGMLNDLGVAASCEADINGALSMYMGMQLTGKAAFFGDPVSLDEGKSTITYWHCGMAACSLAREDTGACAGVHPNRKIGPVMDFGCKPAEKVTVFRVGRTAAGKFRFFVLSGKALDEPKQFCGTSVVVQTDSRAEEVISRSVKEGWEPHFAVIYGDVRKELCILANMIGLEVCEF